MRISFFFGTFSPLRAGPGSGRKRERERERKKERETHSTYTHTDREKEEGKVHRSIPISRAPE